MKWRENSNSLYFTGGFHGSVSGDVLAYTLPKGLATKRNDQVCSHYGSQISCSSNPECGWCPTDGICYLRTSTDKCASNLKTVKCPGLCESLNDCQSCANFGQKQKSFVSKVTQQLNLNQCSWCSHLQECVPTHANPDLCNLQNYPSQVSEISRKVFEAGLRPASSLRLSISTKKISLLFVERFR